MSQSNHQEPLPLVVMDVDQKERSVVQWDETRNGGFSQAQSVVLNSKKLQDDLQKLGMKIKQHESNLKLMKNQKNKLDDSIIDTQVILGKYHSSAATGTENEDHTSSQSEEETIKQILQYGPSAASILCQLRANHTSYPSYLTLTKDVLGIVATLGQVDDDNLSRMLSQYLGMETMLAIVCKSYEGAKALETYDREGHIDKESGIHAVGASLGKALHDPFSVICLEDLRPYCGEFVMDDPQRRLDLFKPKLPTGESPPGFLGFAVNMINVEYMNLFFLTSNGHGLRETLLYNIFSRLQVYKTRDDMLLARPCISDGAISLDGGMIRHPGIFSLGSRMEMNIRFPKSSASSVSSKYSETEKQLTEMRWKKEKMEEDMKREHALLDTARRQFQRKKEEFVKFLAESSTYATQQPQPMHPMQPQPIHPMQQQPQPMHPMQQQQQQPVHPMQQQQPVHPMQQQQPLHPMQQQQPLHPMQQQQPLHPMQQQPMHPMQQQPIHPTYLMLLKQQQPQPTHPMLQQQPMPPMQQQQQQQHPQPTHPMQQQHPQPKHSTQQQPMHSTQQQQQPVHPTQQNQFTNT